MYDNDECNPALQWMELHRHFIPESSSAVLFMIRSKSVSICNHTQITHARRDNSGEITFFRWYPSLMPSFEGNLHIEHHKICSQETRDYTLSYGNNPNSLSHLGLNQYLVVTDGRTELR